MKRLLVAAALLAAACGNKDVSTSAPHPIPLQPDPSLETRKLGARMVPPEVFLRSFLVWFGELTPAQAVIAARGNNLFDTWPDYLAMLGLPDYRGDIPRADQSNAMMQAALGRLAEALCMRTAERDLKGGMPLESRGVYAFDSKPHPSTDEFEAAFDVLHRTFLGYPVALAPPSRTHRFYGLFQQVAARTNDGGALTPDQMAWAAICTALVLHPEAELY